MDKIKLLRRMSQVMGAVFIALVGAIGLPLIFSWESIYMIPTLLLSIAAWLYALILICESFVKGIDWNE